MVEPVLVGEMRLEMMVVMVEQGMALIPLGLPQQVRAIVDITLVVVAVQPKTLH